MGVNELSFLATQINARLMVHPAEVFLFVGAVYWLMCSLLDLCARLLARQATPFTAVSYTHLTLPTIYSV